MGTFYTESVWERSSQTLWIHPSFASSFDHLVGASTEVRVLTARTLLRSWHTKILGIYLMFFAHLVDESHINHLI